MSRPPGTYGGAPQVIASDKRKQSLYFPADMLDELHAEARRLDRSLSWVAQQAWKLSRERIRALPSHEVTP